MIVIADKPGQLGNRLTVFAHFIAFAAEHGLKVAAPALDEYASHFKGPSRDVWCRFPRTKSRVRPSKRTRHLAYLATLRLASFVNLFPKKALPRCRLIRLPFEDRITLGECDLFKASRGLTLVQGWLFRDEEILRRHAHVVRSYFEPIDKISLAVAQRLSLARGNAEILVGVHIRQGDYNETRGRKHFYSTEEYVEVMERLMTTFNGARTSFLVCSNEAQPMEAFGELPVTYGSGGVVEDLYELAGCDYIIGPPSSYSLWASFMGKKPLLMLTDLTQPLNLDDFATAPEIRDPEVRRDY